MGGKGKFIALEGLDGSGQSTQRVLLKNWFRKNAKKCLTTKEPTDSLVGGLIRAQLTGEWSSSPEALQLLFAADRALHLEKDILPALENGVHVVTDRYLFSSVAYGMVNVDKAWLKSINSTFRLPDVTVYLDVRPSECLRRLTGDRVRLELFEKEEYLKKVRENYLEFSRDYRNFYVLNGEQPAETIQEEIIKLVRNRVR